MPSTSRLTLQALACILVAFSPLGCAQHGAVLDADDPVDADESAEDRSEAVDAQAEDGQALSYDFDRPKRLAQRCKGVTQAARPIGAEDGFDRGVLRVKTAKGFQEIPLQETTFETSVLGTVAETSVTQVFANPFDAPIEAIYTFPLHSKAAVDDYWIHVGDRSIHGVIKLREQAKQEYEAAKEEGRTAGLLEQERPNVFTQSVANIMPGESIEVQMHVVQPLGQDDGRYALVLPTVVGPRFVPGAPSSKKRQSGSGVLADTDRVSDASRISPPVLPRGASGCSPVKISVDIEAGFAISGVKSKVHAIDVHAANDITTIELKEGSAVADRDFDLSWDIVRESPQGSFLVQRDRKGTGGFFTLTIEPPDSLRPDAAVPRDLVFVVDNSGSMHGQPMDVAKQTVRQAVRSLNPDDTFQIMRFSETASALSPRPLANTAQNRRRGVQYIDAMNGMGGTEMLEGIKAALGAPHSQGRLPMVLFLTDGYIGNEGEIFAAATSSDGDARIFSVGVGDSPNRFLLDGLAMAGRGGAAYVGISEDPTEAVDKFYERIAFPALTDVAFDWGGLQVHDVVPARIPDLFVGQPIVVYGRFEGKPSGKIKIKGRLGDRDVVLPVAIDFAGKHAQQGSGLASMWARTKIEGLLRDPEVYGLDEKEREKRVEVSTELALEFSVLTEKTAFLAVDTTVVANPDGTTTTIAVPVELPSGVDRASTIGESYGVGGLGLTGTGRGGGGTGQGTIGLGKTGLIGRGSGGGSGSGYGRGAGAGFGGRGTRVPTVRQAKATVTGSLDPDIIRRIVRSHINEVRFCYNQGLAKDPNLAGRIAVKFTIDATGKVVSAELDQSTLPESADDVNVCVTDAMKKWKFPKPAGGGVVVVSYPFVFAPG